MRVIDAAQRPPNGTPWGVIARRHDRGFSLIEAMMASVVMLIGLLGLAGLQVIGARANNVGKRMSQASLLGQDLIQNMEIWSYNDARLTPVNNCTTPCTNTNGTNVTQYINLPRGASSTWGGVIFDYTDSADATGATNVNQLDGTHGTWEGVNSPTDPTLAAGEQTIFSRYWNVYFVDLLGTGSAQGKLVQVAVRWKEPNLGYRQVTMSFYKYDPSQFNAQ